MFSTEFQSSSLFTVPSPSSSHFTSVYVSEQLARRAAVALPVVNSLAIVATEPVDDRPLSHHRYQRPRLEIQSRHIMRRSSIAL